MKEKYITQPDDVVVFEVLSEGDETATKCQHYSEIKISQIFVFDPVARNITKWDGEKLVPVTDVSLSNGVTITGATIWSGIHQAATPPARPTAMDDLAMAACGFVRDPRRGRRWLPACPMTKGATVDVSQRELTAARLTKPTNCFR